LEGYDGGPAVGIAEKSSAMLEGTVPVPDMPIVEAGIVWGRFRDRGRGRLGRTSESLASKSGRYRDCPPRRVEISVRNLET
jgi:hypothetical protein